MKVFDILQDISVSNILVISTIIIVVLVCLCAEHLGDKLDKVIKLLEGKRK